MSEYWNLKNPDLFISKCAKERAELILNQIANIIEKSCKGSYEDLYASEDQPLYYKSNQRIDFMSSVYKEIIKQCTLELSKLENERDRRL